MKSFKKFLTELAFRKDELEQHGSDEIGSSHDVRTYRAKDGSIFYVKTPSASLYDYYTDSVMHILVEFLSYEIYKTFNVKVPFVDLYIKDDQILLASKEAKGKHVNFSELTNYKDFTKSFATDIFLANWDVAGTGRTAANVIIDDEGNTTRIDYGGALTFRAQGGRKGSKFTSHVGEYNSMRDEDMSQVASVYNSHKDMIKQSFRNFFTVSWGKLQSNLEFFNENKIIKPVQELIQDEDFKDEVLEEWEKEFSEIMRKLKLRYEDMKKIYSKIK